MGRLKIMDIYTLLPAVKHYQWGSASLIPELLGIENKLGLPYAELWMGSHPAGTGLVKTPEGKIPLGELIRKDPDYWLGGRSRELSFLLKVLGIAAPLSIQCHPSKQQAQEGFAREERGGIPPDSPGRTYKDANHKPEILCALTEFHALCGFRPIEEARMLFSPLGTEVIGGADDYRTLVMRTFELDQRQIADCIRALQSAGGGPAYELAGTLYRQYGADPGVLAPLYLQIHRLLPGEALFLGPGVLHAYLEGMGVELMANSDNVVRGGLTSKHVDRRELEAVVSFCSSEDPRVQPVNRQGLHVYPVPANDFLLRRAGPGNYHLETDYGLEVGLVTDGEAVVTAAGRSCRFGRGAAFVIPASMPAYTLACSGELFIASGGEGA